MNNSVVVLALLALWGCDPAPRPLAPNAIYQEPWPGIRVIRVVDSATVCYVYAGNNQGGIWCRHE